MSHKMGLQTQSAESYIAECAQRLIDAHGFEGARIECAKWRDQNAWGTYTHSWYVQVGKAIEQLKQEAA